MTRPTPTAYEPGPCPFDRRALLVSAGLAAAASLTGCGSDTPSAAGAPAEPQATTPPATGPAELPAGALTRAADVPVGGGVAASGGTVLVVQPTSGVFKAFDARCTHRGAPVNPPDASGTIVCPKHNAQFRASDGSVQKGPAERALPGIAVKVDGEYVVRA